MLPSALAPFLAAASIAGSPAAADQPPNSVPSWARTSAPVLVAGVVRDEAGAPVAGPVSVSVMPRDVEEGDTYPVVAQGIADADGRYEARVTDPITLQQIADRQNGWVETVTASDNAASASPGIRSIRVWEDESDRLQVTPGLEARRALGENAPVPAVTPTLDLTVAPPEAPAADGQRGAPTRACSVTPLWKVISREKAPAWTVVGELNNAYNDGTVGTFSYGRGGERSTSIGVAVSVSMGGASGGFSITDESTIANSARVTFAPFNRRLARKMRTQFLYLRTTEERKCRDTGVKDVRRTIRAIGWEGGTNTEVKQPEALDQCDRSVVGPYYGGDTFIRDRTNAARYTVGANAFGVALTTQTSFSKNVTTEYRFGGRRSKKHYICGQDGRSPATTSGRIFSGGRR